MKQNNEKTTETTTGQLPGHTFRRSDAAYCFICQKPVKLLTFSQAAGFFETDVAHFCRLSEMSDLHRIHNRKGKVMICGDSLFALLNHRQQRISNSGFTLKHSGI